MSSYKFTMKQRIMLFTPIVLILTMYAAFRGLAVVLGFPLGYLVAFLIYWIGWCIIFPLFILKFPGVLDLFRETKPRFGKTSWKTLALLLWPLPFPILFRFLPKLPDVNLSIILASIIIGVTTGITEEILWRGVYVRIFPNSIWLSYIYPSIGFALWHICPQSVLPNPDLGGMASFVFFALLLGLSWGYYARKTNSILWCTIVHCIHDSFGLGAFMYFS